MTRVNVPEFLPLIMLCQRVLNIISIEYMIVHFVWTCAYISAAIISADTTSADTILVAIITGTTTRSASSVEIRSRMRGQLPLPKRFAMQADRAAHQRYVCATTSLN